MGYRIFDRATNKEVVFTGAVACDPREEGEPGGSGGNRKKIWFLAVIAWFCKLRTRLGRGSWIDC